MVKTVMDSDQVTHVWASQSQREGRNAKSSVWFEGPALYSYGTHYLTGYIVDPLLADNQRIVFLNTETRSITTSRHQSAARWATNHLTQIMLPDLTNLRDALTRGQSSDWGKRDVQRYIENAEHVGAPVHELGALFGFRPAQIAAMQRKAISNAAKAKALAKKNREASELREAVSFADMTDAEFFAWQGDAYLSRYPEPITYHNVGYKRDRAKRAALRLFNARKVGRAHKFSARRLARLLARERTVREYMAGLDEMAAKTAREQVAAHVARFADEWNAATTEQDRENVATRNSLSHWREFYEAGTPERDLIDAGLAATASANERYEREQRTKDAEQFSKWQAGESVQCPYSYRSHDGGKAYVRRFGDELQTSQGARVPWSHAVRAFQFIALCVARGEAWHTNGRIVRVGHFQIDSIASDGTMRAGCHAFAWPDMLALAEREGVQLAPSADAVEAR